MSAVTAMIRALSALVDGEITVAEVNFLPKLSKIVEFDHYSIYCAALEEKNLPILKKGSVHVAIAELLRFLTIKKIHKEAVVPSVIINELWSEMVLIPIFYQQVCYLIASGQCMIDYEPIDEVNGNLRKRYEMTKQQYASMFPSGPLQRELWPEDIEDRKIGILRKRKFDSFHFPSFCPLVRNIQLIDQFGVELLLKVRDHTSMSQIYQAYAERRGVNKEELQITYAGETVSPDDTALSMCLMDGEQLDVVINIQ